MIKSAFEILIFLRELRRDMIYVYNCRQYTATTGKKGHECVLLIILYLTWDYTGLACMHGWILVRGFPFEKSLSAADMWMTKSIARQLVTGIVLSIKGPLCKSNSEGTNMANSGH